MPKSMRRSIKPKSIRTTKQPATSLNRYRTIRTKRLIKVFDGGSLVLEIPLNSKGEIPKRYAFDRLLAVYEGTRRGRKRNAAVDQKRKAGRVFKRSDIDAYLWVLYPNESDLEGVDTHAAPFPKVQIRTENDLATVQGVNSELSLINAKITKRLRAGRPIDNLLDERDGLFDYREGLLESNLGEQRYLKLGELRDELGDREIELAGREEAASAIERPAWGKGLSNETLLRIAEHEGRNPYDPDWGDSIDPVVVREARQGGSLSKGQESTISRLRDDVRNLRKEIRTMERMETATQPVETTPVAVQSRGQMQSGFGIGEAPPQGSLLGEFRDDGARVALIDRDKMEAKANADKARKQGQSSFA